MSAQTVKIPKQFVRADIVPESLDREARTFDVVWTTGARVLRGWFDRYWEELSLDPAHVMMGRMEAGAPVLADHLALARATYGVTENARLESGRGVSKVRFLSAGKDPEADRLFERVAERIVTGISVSYITHKLVKTEETRDGFPVYRAEKWEPLEISLTPIPADAGAHVRSEAGETFPCEIITRGVEAPQKERGSMTPEEMAAEEAERKAKLEAEAQRQVEAAVKAERERVAEVQRIARQAQVPAEAAEAWVKDGKTPDQARALALDLVATRSERAGGPGPGPSGAVEVTVTEREKMLRGMEAAIIERAGLGRSLAAVAKRAAEDPHFMPSVDVADRLRVDGNGGEFRGRRLVEMARHCLERSGGRTAGLYPMDIIGQALIRSGPYQGTSDFAVLLENVMHKALLAAYATVQDTWRTFCGTDTVSDFRPHNRYRNGSFGSLDTLNEHGEFKNKPIPDGAKYVIDVETRGNIIALTRQMLVNDDLGAMMDLATRFGRSGGYSIETSVYALLTLNGGLGPTQSDAQPFFHANRKNVNAVGSALSANGIDADCVVLAEQKDISGNEVLNLQQRVLLIPRALQGEALLLNTERTDPLAAGTNANRGNKVRGFFETITATTRLTGTRRYIFADPAVVPVIKVVFLEGQGETPILESKDGWRVDGTEWKVRLDFKAQMFDPKGAVTNAGA